ncbi:Ran-specific GTPase-activating protein, putative [Perkinsus marinus ATCC 50983]|uniref:Ran-specific GTPase-activating protein, putative n=1 Tax=Perkinsus marinus (strain ATCC 50983 / TXsc) TaxID=423536 RepID=C5KDI5_PERM5|nr:Ran-specific GTPase-activating protein, putative [Perkinsus marinus ATCC 50983]EER17458.1 Ran-specific GTPase-activating protein, putative [Perkinsus marinus ATCC 50983]|eukprot:XP_002785662.1 Ran-specific GTPase-activating protein, putative [Perkinsus marinus ATCC 50983]
MSIRRWISKDEGSGEWKERGTGEMRLLKEKKSGRVRALMRQEKTLKIIANHYVVENGPYCSLKPNAGSQKCWVWMASDYAEGEQRTEQFALKFGNPELAQAFEKAFNEAKQENAKIISGEKTKKNEAAEKEEKEEEDEKKKEE